MNTEDPLLPGRLGSPQLKLAEDPRLDPRLRPLLAAADMFAPGVGEPPMNASFETCLEYCAAFETAAMAMHPLALAAMPEFPTVKRSVEVIEGSDGNQISLYIHQPRERSAPAPAILHTHGGGMVLMTAADPGFERWRNTLASMGAVVVGVEFRNGGGRLGNHPFPAGLNDCVSAAQWLHAQRSPLQLSAIVLNGESGGGNLAIATAMKAVQGGWGEAVDGVYACCPYISGTYAEPPAELRSQIENAGYLLSAQTMNALARVYDPLGEQSGNPLAWPLQASDEELALLPPHFVSVNELDPLRDEGLVFYRRLLAAGVTAVGRTVHGTPHAGDLTFPDVIPDVYSDSARSLLGFAETLG